MAALVADCDRASAPAADAVVPVCATSLKIVNWRRVIRTAPRDTPSSTYLIG
jgi:hypothetical protein